MSLAISQAENGTRQCDRVVNEPNGSKSYGLFMINSVHLKKGYTEADLKDCTTNIKIAKQIFDRQGWSPWSVYKNGLYKRFYETN
jgi:hypothetical protein